MRFNYQAGCVAPFALADSIEKQAIAATARVEKLTQAISGRRLGGKGLTGRRWGRLIGV